MLAWFLDFLHFTLAMLAVCAPQSAIPVFLNLTDGMGTREKSGIARQTGVAVACILLCSAFFGSALLDMFGISLNSFRIAGGILLITIAFGMMKASEKRHTKEEEAEAESRDAIGVMPLAIPIISGPGAISAMVIATEFPIFWRFAVPPLPSPSSRGCCCASPIKSPPSSVKRD